MGMYLREDGIYYSNESLERLIRNQRGLSKMYINDTDKESQYIAKYYSDIADEYEEELKRRKAIETQTAV